MILFFHNFAVETPKNQKNMKSIFKIICLTAILLTAYPSAAQNYTMKNSKNYEVVNLGVATD